MLYDPDSLTWFYTEDREVKPRETISGAIQAETPMDAVVCYNDQVAVEVIRTLSEFGKKVPRDVSATLPQAAGRTISGTVRSGREVPDGCRLPRSVPDA